MNGWVGFDLDGTLAEYNGWQGATHIGAPIPKIVKRLKEHLASGQEVRIFTARVYPLGCTEQVSPGRMLEATTAKKCIEVWCQTHIGQVLPVTCIKDFGMILLYDDRARQVELNTGRVVGG